MKDYKIKDTKLKKSKTLLMQYTKNFKIFSKNISKNQKTD